MGAEDPQLRKTPSSTSSSCLLRRRSRLPESPGLWEPIGTSERIQVQFHNLQRRSYVFKDLKPHDLLLTTQATGPSYAFAGRERRRTWGKQNPQTGESFDKVDRNLKISKSSVHLPWAPSGSFKIIQLDNQLKRLKASSDSPLSLISFYLKSSQLSLQNIS